MISFDMGLNKDFLIGLNLVDPSIKADVFRYKLRHLDLLNTFIGRISIWLTACLASSNVLLLVRNLLLAVNKTIFIRFCFYFFLLFFESINCQFYFCVGQLLLETHLEDFLRVILG